MTYEIDLTTARAAELRDALAKWVAAGRKVGAGPVGLFVLHVPVPAVTAV